MVSSLLTYKVRGGKSRGKEGKAHNSKAILIPSARKNTLPPHTSCYLPGGLRAIQMCAILPYRANSLSMSRSVASGSRFPTYTWLQACLLACCCCVMMMMEVEEVVVRGRVCGRGREAEAQDDHPAWRLEGGSQVVLFFFLALLGTGATAASGSSHSPPPMAGRRPTLSIDDGPECV